MQESKAVTIYFIKQSQWVLEVYLDGKYAQSINTAIVEYCQGAAGNQLW